MRRATVGRAVLLLRVEISIHALREEGDGCRPFEADLRGVISIHALREEGDASISEAGADLVDISIHALREEGDWDSSIHSLPEQVFLSTPSVRRATVCGILQCGPRSISIHALREEGDLVVDDGHLEALISIHALREEGDAAGGGQGFGIALFLSTPSVRRATDVDVLGLKTAKISIHALREEGDLLVHQSGIPLVVISIHALREEGDGRSA